MEKDYLRQSAQKYDIVEVDQWFWSLFGDKFVMPKPEVVAEYVASVPKDGELHKLKLMVNELLHNEVKVTLNVNNHYEGFAPMTIDRFINYF